MLKEFKSTKKSRRYQAIRQTSLTHGSSRIVAAYMRSTNSLFLLVSLILLNSLVSIAYGHDQDTQETSSSSLSQSSDSSHMVVIPDASLSDAVSQQAHVFNNIESNLALDNEPKHSSNHIQQQKRYHHPHHHPNYRANDNHQTKNLQQQQKYEYKSHSIIRKNDGSRFRSHNHKKYNPTHQSQNDADLEVLKKDVLINAFKIKLLQLLDVDQVPDVSNVNISSSVVPEPIMREFKRLMKQSQSNSKSHSHSSHSRAARDKTLYEEMDELQKLENEEIRFNGSFVKEMILLPEKSKPSENDCEERVNTVTESTMISCYSIKLDQKEFHEYQLNSANLFIKIDMKQLNELFLTSLLALELQAFQGSRPHSFRPYMYVEANNRLLEQVNLVKEFAKTIDQDSSKSTPIYLDSIDVKYLIDKQFESDHNDTSPIHLNIKLSLSNDLLNFTKSLDEIESIFAKRLDEQAALNVKFGERIPHAREAASMRKKRYVSKSAKYESNHQLNLRTNHKDCSELRRYGFASNNMSCCREVLSFSMEQLGWSHWILSPKVIEYKYCRGGCYDGLLPRYDNTNIVYRMFEISNTFDTVHCCNIYDYEDDIPFIYGTPPHYHTKLVSLNAKSCKCS